MKKYFVLFIFTFLFLNGLLTAKEPGDIVENFSVKNFDGNVYSPGDLKDSKALVVIFWSTQCPFVQAYNDRINDLVSAYQQKGFVFWMMNSNTTEAASEVETHSKSNKYVFPVLKDENSVVADLFGATRTPEVFVLNQNRVILYHGRIDDNKNKLEVTSHDLENALNDIAGGKEVTVKNTKQFGCTIKRNEK